MSEEPREPVQEEEAENFLPEACRDWKFKRREEEESADYLRQINEDQNDQEVWGS